MRVTISKKTDEFIANTAILYKGELIAIWRVEGQVDSIVLTSKIVHEMFHGFQMMNKDSRFSDELDALYRYRYEEQNLNLKLQENQLLYHLSIRYDAEKFAEFLRRRKYRRNAFEYAYHYESSVEQIEGTANYVELYCLQQLSAELFESKLLKMRERIINPNNLFPIRVICYDIGALLLHVLTENNIAFADGFSFVALSAFAAYEGIAKVLFGLKNNARGKVCLK